MISRVDSTAATSAHGGWQKSLTSVHLHCGGMLRVHMQFSQFSHRSVPMNTSLHVHCGGMLFVQMQVLQHAGTSGLFTAIIHAYIYAQVIPKKFDIIFQTLKNENIIRECYMCTDQQIPGVWN